MKRLSIITTAVIMGAAIGSVPAGAATQPATPTVHIQDGGDAIIGALDAMAVEVIGTWDATDLNISDIVVDVTAAPGCDGTGGVSAVLHATPYPDGTFTAGPFDLSTFADDTLLCARATTVWNDSTLSEVGLSDNQPLLNISVDPGTVEFLDADGFMNAAEAATSGSIEATYAHTDPLVVSSAVQFLDAAAALADPSCDLGSGLAVSDTVALPLACAAALPDGPFTIEVTWLDNAGNTATANASLIKDTFSVRPIITSPLANAQVRPAPFAVTGTSEPDALLEVIEVRFYGDDERVVVGTAQADSTGRWSTEVSGLLMGDRYLTAVATDPAGNESALAATVLVRVDATVPYIVSPQADSLRSRYLIVSGIGRPGDQVRVFEGSTQLVQTDVHPDGAWSAQISRSTGQHTIFARGLRNGVPSGPSETRTFRVDGDIPSVAITSPTGEPLYLPGSAMELKGTASDVAGLGAGIARVRVIYTDGVRGSTIGSEVASCIPAAGGPASCGTGAVSVTWKAGSLPVGPALVVASVYAEDMAGNASLVKTVRYTRL